MSYKTCQRGKKEDNNNFKLWTPIDWKESHDQFQEAQVSLWKFERCMPSRQALRVFSIRPLFYQSPRTQHIKGGTLVDIMVIPPYQGFPYIQPHTLQ